MFSKLSRRSFAAVLTFTLGTQLAACGRWIDGKKSKEEVIEMSATRFQCLNAMPETMKAFVAGEARETQIREGLGCLRDAFVYFRERTRGTFDDAYTPEDLRKFFGKYFLKENNLSPALAQGLMKLKRALLAGSDEYITKDEIDRLVTLLKVVEDEFVKLAPHMKILILMETGDVGNDRLARAVAQMRASLLVLLEKVDLSRSDYTYRDAENLFAGLAAFIGGPSGFALFNSIGDWIPMVEAVKNVFFGERATLQGLREWKDAIGTLVDLYDLVLRYRYLLMGRDLGSPDQVAVVLEFGEKIFTLLENSHQLSKTGRIPFHQINELIDVVGGGDRPLFHLPVSANAIKGIYQKVINKMLDPVRRGDSRGADSLERIHLLSLRREFNVFRINQAFVESLASGNKMSDKLRLQTSLENFPIAPLVDRLTRGEPLEREALLAAWNKFRALLTKDRPVAFDSRGRVVITTVPDRLEWSWGALTRFNLMSSLVRLFMLGYGDRTDPRLRPEQMTCSVAGLEEWYDDFREIGVEMKAFDPNAKNSGGRSHKEANFFTYSGNGDPQVDTDELFEFVSFLFSAGLGNAHDVREAMKAGQCELREIDSYDLPWMDEACFRRELRARFPNLFGNLPALTAVVAAMSDDQWNEFSHFLMVAARSSDPAGGRVDTGDLRTAVMILHYAESLFVNYDADRSNTLSTAELKRAAPRFLNLIRPFSPFSGDTAVTEVFVTMVYAGERPGAGSFIGRLWTSEPTRLNILKVFANLKAELTGK